jgi:hypothetical protein
MRLGSEQSRRESRAERVFRKRTEVPPDLKLRPQTARGQCRLTEKKKDKDKEKEKVLGKLEMEMERHRKILAVENKRVFVETSSGPICAEKQLLRKILETYRGKLIEQRRRELEMLLKAKEQFIERLDNAMIDIDRIYLETELSKKDPTHRQPPVLLDEKALLEDAAELREKLAANPSKYQTNFCSDMEMRQAFSKNFVFVDPLEELRRLRTTHEHLPFDETDIRHLATRIIKDLKEDYQTAVNELQAESKLSLNKFSQLNEILADSSDDCRYKSPAVRDLFTAVKQGNVEAAKELLTRDPKLILETDNVFVP